MRLPLDTTWIRSTAGKLPGDALWIVLIAGAYAAENGTGGRVPAVALDALTEGAPIDVGAGLNDARAAGLIVIESDGSIVVRAEWIPQPDEVDRARAQARERQARFRARMVAARNAVTNGVSNAVTNGVTNGVTPSAAIPQASETRKRKRNGVTNGVTTDIDSDLDLGTKEEDPRGNAVTNGVTPDELQALWNERANPKLPRWRAMSPSRRKASLVRLRELPSLADWARVIDGISASAWHTGANERGWLADPEFLLRPGTWARFLDAAAEPEQASREAQLERAGYRQLTDEEMGGG